MREIGRLVRVGSIRDIWPDEARDLTPWLASEKNLPLLAEALGFGADGLEVEGIEESVGPFRADIICRDTNSAEAERVLIENQYGKTDHDHLGKLITYGAGLKAGSVVLIAETIRAEHRAALDWLNEMSDDDHRFFAVTVDLWRIGDSAPAPRFNVVVAPNDWSRSVAATVREGLSDRQRFYLAYWGAFRELVDNTTSRLRSRKPAPQSWTGFGIGRKNFEINVAANPDERWMRAELTLFSDDSKAWLGLLERDREEIERELGFALIWDSMPDRKGARISISRTGVELTDEAGWADQHRWLAEKAEALHRVFHPRIPGLDSTDWQDGDARA